LPYEKWSGFCYNELGWTPKDFWGSTVWDVVSAMIYFNDKNTPHKKVDVKKLREFERNMQIKGFI
jgi:hypothetical protein